MATITISQLNQSGIDLFQDSESFLNELTDTEMDLTKGGIHPSWYLLIYAPDIIKGIRDGWNAA
ncbi:MAG: hypothetical protein QNJ47_12010 [Nostocaceae cyanobacterium]|nr:hypothetical protein [Nostocaceae cyanobacterium]